MILRCKTKFYTKYFVMLLFLPVLFGLFTGCGNEEEKQVKNLIETIKEYKGYEREIGQEEYDFYTYFANEGSSVFPPFGFGD